VGGIPVPDSVGIPQSSTATSHRAFPTNALDTPKSSAPTSHRPFPTNAPQHARLRNADGPVRKTTTDWNLVAPRIKSNQPTLSSSTGTGTGTGSPQLQNSEGDEGDVDYKKEYLFFKDRCTKMEVVIKRARDMVAKNQKLEEEIEQLRSSSGFSTERVENERKHRMMLLQKDAEISNLKQKLEDILLEKEVVQEQIADQNKLIERLENGFKMAMDQVDYLTKNVNLETEKPVVNSPVSNFDPYAEEDDLNYDDLDEETLLKLLSQTKQALMDKRSSLSLDSINLDYNF